MKSSLHAAFIGIWLFVVATCVALAILMQGLYRLGVDAQVDTVAARVDKAAVALRSRFAFYAHSYAEAPDYTDAQRRRELGLILQIVLDEFEDVEGGFYHSSAGFLAYAFPSYEGSGAKQDVPEAESARIAEIAQSASESGQTRTLRVPGTRQTLILESLPAENKTKPLAIWVMSRAHVRSDDGTRRLLVGLGVLAFFIIASGVALLVILRRWDRALAVLGRTMSAAPIDPPTPLAPTGHRDLDRVGAMVSDLLSRLDAERRESMRLEGELARARRVSAMGRMAAQLVHEIRNPIAAMRLHVENALAGAGERGAALQSVLDDVHRLDDLLERMQAMTRLNALRVRDVALQPWLTARIASVAERAVEAQVSIVHDAPDGVWPLDPEQLARALDNLLLNAIQHAPRERGVIRVTIAVEPAVACRIRVEDNGPGIPDDALAQIFDSFHTTRADGSGLGLSIAREIVEAHGGSLRAEAHAHGAGSGALFIIELPWPAS